MQIEAKLQELGLVLPEPFKTPPGLQLPFSWARVRGNRVYISGHGPLNPNGTLAGPFGKVGVDVSTEEAYRAARLIALAILSSLKRELGDLDRVTAWLRVLGMVNAAPGFTRTTSVRLTLAPRARLPTFQRPVWRSYVVPGGGAALTKVTPTGNRSVRRTPPDSSRP